MKINFSPPYITDAVINEVTDALKSGWITTGPKCRALENLVCDYTKANATLCVNSATSGLMLALKWYGVGKGDEVIIPAYTYAATALAVLHIGAKPVMVDINDDFNIATQAIANAITENTKAIMPVDIAGWPCDYNDIKTILQDKISLFNANSPKQELLKRPIIIADSAHSIGATYNTQPLGSVADITVFSFHAVKNVTTAEGGAVCLSLPDSFNTEDEYKLLKLMSLNGQTKDAFTKSKAGGWKYDIVLPGFKINLPDVLAAIGLAQLPEYFKDVLPKRKTIFEYYNEGFTSKSWAILPPYQSDNKKSSCHLYPIRIAGITETQRDAIITDIANCGVAVNVHFQPLPMLTVFKNLGYDIADYPNAYNNYKSEISLPIYPQLTTEQLNYIINTVITAVENNL